MVEFTSPKRKTTPSGVRGRAVLDDDYEQLLREMVSHEGAFADGVGKEDRSMRTEGVYGLELLRHA